MALCEQAFYKINVGLQKYNSMNGSSMEKGPPKNTRTKQNAQNNKHISLASQPARETEKNPIEKRILYDFVSYVRVSVRLFFCGIIECVFCST